MTTHAQLDTWLETMLLRQLSDDWEQLNWELFGSAMRRPIFELCDSEGLLGSWRAQDRTISISRAAAMTRPWAETLETLKHEAAHQYVDEVLGGDDTPHGPRFREVCCARGIDARATGVATGTESSAVDSARLRVVARVQKLLALAQSSNRNEAELAAATAQRIMLKYNLDLQRDGGGESSECGHLWIGEPTGRVQAHQYALASLLIDHFFVHAIWIRVYRPREAKHGSVLEICGRPENLAMAEYVHQFVLGTIERLWREHKRTAKLRSDRDRRSFLSGAVRGLRDKLKSQRRNAEQEGLVWTGDAQARAYYRRRHPRIVSTGGSSVGSRDAYAKGKSAGERIVISKPVHGESTPATPRALGPAK
jgi:hypothetical protein